MKYFTLATLLLIFTLIGRLPAGDVAPMPREVFLYHNLAGIVTDIDKNSITLKFIDLLCAGATHREEHWENRICHTIYTGKSIRAWGSIGRFEATRLAHDDRDNVIITGTDGKVREFRIEDQPPRQLLVAGWLAAGEFYPTATGPYSYRLADVKINDRIRIKLIHTRDQINIVSEISISRRPGGRIPVAPGEPPNRKAKHHERMQAIQDWEEKGTAVPTKYHPGGPIKEIAPLPRVIMPKP